MGAIFQSDADILHVRTKSVPVEEAHSMSVVERYHALLLRAFQIIQKEVPEIEAKECLRMAVKGLNDSVEPDGLIHTLLFFGALPRFGFPNDNPTPSTLKCAIAQQNATARMSKHFASTQVQTAISTRNGPDVT